MAAAKRWPLIDQLRSEFLAEQENAPEAGNGAAGGDGRPPSQPLPGQQQQPPPPPQQQQQHQQRAPPQQEPSPAAGGSQKGQRGGPTAQLEVMLARLPTARLAAHEAEIEQLRPLLERVRRTLCNMLAEPPSLFNAVDRTWPDKAARTADRRGS